MPRCRHCYGYLNNALLLSHSGSIPNLAIIVQFLTEKHDQGFPIFNQDFPGPKESRRVLKPVCGPSCDPDLMVSRDQTEHDQPRDLGQQPNRSAVGRDRAEGTKGTPRWTQPLLPVCQFSLVRPNQSGGHCGARVILAGGCPPQSAFRGGTANGNRTEPTHLRRQIPWSGSDSG